MPSGMESKLIFGRYAGDTLPRPVAVDANGNIITTSTGSATPTTVTDDWEITHIQDLTLNEGYKTITLPVGYDYQILGIYVYFSTSATVGDRLIAVSWGTPAVLYGFVVTGATQAASLVRNYMFAPALPDLTAFRLGGANYHLMSPLPPTVFLNGGSTINIFDMNVVDWAADDSWVHIHLARRAQ